ncbi:hypothetical protein PoB_006069500 [Plakobranchus ocellatus]|uniref:Uncharacterized protein n=1 Tax=Plakobranchus ocellatus TaxID=259542 RepID=A0AAV4CQU2_9GAST|nr:hypothetical protein PoB_006069500 [Plakobranchus ocellatus]
MGHDKVKGLKDSRFNDLFILSASTCFYIDHFLHVLSLVEQPNKKLAALKEDFQDQDLMNLVLGLGIMYLVKITRLFGNMITSTKTTYLELGPINQKLHGEFKKVAYPV